jgi:tripartite motif-containing protein 71
VAVGPGNQVYVTDTDLGRTQVFTHEGTFVTQWTTQAYGIAVDAAGNVFVTENNGVRKYTSSGAELAHWGTSGTQPGQFNAPFGIAVDASGNVYVADTRNSRVQAFTGSGAFITQWGALGRRAGQFDNPQGIAVDAAGRVYVADSFNDRVQIFGSVPTPANAESWGSIKARYR